MRLGFLITGLSILIVANILVVYGFKVAPRASSEGFTSYFLNEAAGAKTAYQPIGAFDGVDNRPKNGVSAWKYNAPDAPLRPGAKEFVPTQDKLFMFADNTTGPECCGASISSGSLCTCVTKEQRQYIASRGGNRTHEDI